jgi:hypothetical protein
VCAHMIAPAYHTSYALVRMVKRVASQAGRHQLKPAMLPLLGGGSRSLGKRLCSAAAHLPLGTAAGKGRDSVRLLLQVRAADRSVLSIVLARLIFDKPGKLAEREAVCPGRGNRR